MSCLTVSEVFGGMEAMGEPGVSSRAPSMANSMVLSAQISWSGTGGVFGSEGAQNGSSSLGPQKSDRRWRFAGRDSESSTLEQWRATGEAEEEDGEGTAEEMVGRTGFEER